jgi:GMP reductase
MIACLPKRIFGWGMHCEHAIHSIGLNDDVQTKTGERFICLDIANGYMERVVERVKYLRSKSNCVIIVGNVVTPEMVTSLILAGADVVKIGIGSGSACSTRMKTGVGYPQLSAIIECSDAAHGLGGHIISDGGCTCPGDVVKAFAAGADFVMLGGMLAGHNENGLSFQGESSKARIESNYGGLHDYRTEEGWSMELPNRGNLQNTLQDILGGLRSACAYVGARKLKDLPKCANFIKVNNQMNTSLWKHRI